MNQQDKEYPILIHGQLTVPDIALSVVNYIRFRPYSIQWIFAEIIG